MRWVNLAIALILIPFMLYRISTGELGTAAIEGALAALNLLIWWRPR